MKEFAQDFFNASDRETAITFVSLLAAAYAWIVAEELFLGIGMGLAMHAIQVTAYEYLAQRFGWKRLEVAIAFRKHILPRLLELRSMRQRA
jgi:hypothetical protein